ncbi:MAG: hypothetical protein GY866_38970 [Proteobacteria bacterium]|nr:hypothetical protein [Pseudomonadota bacterium]
MKAAKNSTVSSEQNGALDPMVILVHLLRRYMSEILKKRNYAVDTFFATIRERIVKSGSGASSEEGMGAFQGLLGILQKEHDDILRGVSASDRMRIQERKVIDRIRRYDGSDVEAQALLEMLQGIKMDNIFRRKIDFLIKQIDMEIPVDPNIPKKFSAYIDKLLQNAGHFKKLLAHTFEKAVVSQRMAKLSATIFVLLDDDKYRGVLQNVFPRLLSISGHDESFINIYTNLFLAKNPSEDHSQYYKRVSSFLKQDLHPEKFSGLFTNLPANQLKKGRHPLAAIFKSLMKSHPDFLHRLTHRIFIEAKNDSLSKVPLEISRRGLIQIFRYSNEKADDYLENITKSINYYYDRYLPENQKDKSHFYLMISALSKYGHDLLEEISKSTIFRDSEVDTLMPIIDAIRLFQSNDDKTTVLEEVWEMLKTVRQKKEIRDELTAIMKLTDVSSPAYLKDFIPHIVKLLAEPERFRLVFASILEQTRVDPKRFGSTIVWHTNLLNNVCKYLCDSAITVDEDFRPLLSRLIVEWLNIDDTYMFQVIHLFRAEHYGTLRNLLSYLKVYHPETLIRVIQSLVRLEDERHMANAGSYVQFFYTSLLEQARVPGMTASDTKKEIEIIRQMFGDCFTDLGDAYERRKQQIFSVSYMASIEHLLVIKESSLDENFMNLSENGSGLPPLILSLISQSAKIFSIANFGNRVVAGFSEIFDSAVEELDNEHIESLDVLEKVAELYKFFARNYKFPRITNNSVFHTFASRNDFDHFSFVFLLYAVSKNLDWGPLMFRNAWRDISVTAITGNNDLDLKNNTILHFNQFRKTKARFYKDVDRLLSPMKAETAIDTFFHLKNGIALCETKRYRLATISLDKAIEANRINIFAHYWKAFALKQAKIQLDQVEGHVDVVRRYYPNSQEIEDLQNVQF